MKLIKKNEELEKDRWYWVRQYGTNHPHFAVQVRFNSINERLYADIPGRPAWCDRGSMEFVGPYEVTGPIVMPAECFSHSVVQEVQNQVTMSGKLNEMLKDIIASNSPDGIFCMLGELVNKSAATAVELMIRRRGLSGEVAGYQFAKGRKSDPWVVWGAWEDCTRDKYEQMERFIEQDPTLLYKVRKTYAVDELNGADIRSEVREMVNMLVNNEWAEHVGKDPDAQVLESMITTLIGRISSAETSLMEYRREHLNKTL